MRIAIDVSPLESGHSIRGVGFYLKRLKESLEKYQSSHFYLFFTTESKLREDVDLIHYPYFDPFFLSLPYKRKAKTIVTVHDLTPLVFPDLFPVGIKGKVKWFLQRKILRTVDAIITDSEASKKDIIRLTGIDKKKIHVIYLAAGEEFSKIHNSESRIQNVTKKYQLPEKFALYVGDVTPNKNLPRLVDAATKAKVPLIMVGKSLVNTDYDKTNAWNADLVTVQEMINGNSYVKTIGFVPTEDLTVLYSLATLFVFPSLYEGFGLPILEAMQLGCPVITSKDGSLKEVAGEAALFIDPLDAQSIEKKLSMLFHDTHLQKRLTEKGFIQAKKFTWEQVAKETVAVYEKFI